MLQVLKLFLQMDLKTHGDMLLSRNRQMNVSIFSPTCHFVTISPFHTYTHTL